MIKLDKYWYITADSNQYILARKTLSRNRKTGEVKEVMEYKAYFTTLEHAYRRYAEIALRGIIADPDESTLAEVLEELRKVTEEVRTAVADATKTQ